LIVDTLKKLWRNEYFQTAIMVIAINGIVFGSWFGVQWALNTEYPALAVASKSMLPTLNVGDLIIVQGTPPSQIYANYLNGDIIVFRNPNPNPNNPNDLIVHRAIYKEQRGDVYYFTTHGDNNPNPTSATEGPFPDSYLVGKVVGRISNVGNFALLVHTQQNMYLFTILIIIIIVIILTFLPETDKEEESTVEKQTKKKTKLFGILDIKIIYLLVLNLLIIVFIVFSLWGALTFWQPGSNPPQDVTIRGMYSDVQYHESDPYFKPPYNYNNIQNVSLSQGFLTYTINCLASDGVHEGVRTGVPTFSWTQAAIILLVLFDTWELIKFIRSRKTAETQSCMNEEAEKGSET
jgi:signal peptidase I